MSFLPIAERELRVAARKRSTFWLRVVAAMVGLIIGSGFMLIATVQPAGLPSMGSILFGALTWICVVAAFSAGIFFTADCLSEEKREGTLGFLFLTDLRGYDVVLGKLLATSLRCLFGMLAVFPILAITLLMGGVTGLEFWKAVLALVNALFLSLAAGLMISSIGRDSQKVMGGTLVLLLILVVAGPVTDGIMAALRKRTFIPHWSLSSAAYAFTSAGDWGKTLFWQALFISHAQGWLALLLACLLVPRTWQERATKRNTPAKAWAYSWKYGGERRRAGLRRKLLDRDPVVWLACRERWQSVGIWIIALTVTVAMALAVSKSFGGIWFVWNYVGWLFTMLIYLWTASQACRFFFDVRRSGLVELLLASPITEREIVRGQWSAFFRMFGVPVVLLVAVHVTGVAMSQGAWKSMMVSGTQTSTGTQIFPLSLNDIFPFIGAGLAACAMAGNIAALAWFGMWMGFTSKNATLATLKTIALVQVIPWMVISFGSSLLLAMLIIPLAMKSGPAARPNWFMSLYPFLSVLLASLLSLAKDIAFILWSRKRLYSSFRERAARGIDPIQVFSPPPTPPPVAAPPLIPAQT